MPTAVPNPHPEPARYNLYLDADLNRVFTGSLLDVAATELRIVLDGAGVATAPDPVTDIERHSQGRAQMLTFRSNLPEDTLAATVGQLSAAAALFVQPEPQSDLVRAIPIDEQLTYGSELVTIQRYRGKTSERLTRAMLNIALTTAEIDLSHPKGTVLDPMCGRGTTLNWALSYGMNGVGIDVDSSSLEQHAIFVQTWAKRSRLPHKMERHRPSNRAKRVATLRVAPDRATLKSGGSQVVETFNADSGDDTLAIKRGSIDAVITDMPYGVQHGAGETLAILERVLPAWHRLLRPGGSVCLAWNTKRASRRDVSRALAGAGFAPVTVAGGFSMRHVVDATIDRDVIVATR